MGNKPQEATSGLIAGFKKNDEQILRQVYGRIYPLVERHILKNNGDSEQAKDIFQEAFIHCWRNVKEDKMEEGNLEGYLYTIAKNKWTDFLRSAKFKRTSTRTAEYFLQVVTDEQEPETVDDMESNRLAVRQGWEKIGNNCKQLLELFYYGRKSMEDIAITMGTTAASAKNQKYRCMQKLRNISLQIKNNGK